MSGKFLYIWENDKLRTKLNIFAIENKKLLSQCDELKAKLEKAEKALEYYSLTAYDQYNHMEDRLLVIESSDCERLLRKDYAGYLNRDCYVGGKLARKTLKEIRGEG